jgi:hypothetical protein
MPKLDPTADSELVAVRLTPELLAALDAEVRRQREAHPDLSIGRSNVLRGLIRRGLLSTAVEAPPRPVEAPVLSAPVPRPSKPGTGRPARGAGGPAVVELRERLLRARDLYPPELVSRGALSQATGIASSGLCRFEKGQRGLAVEALEALDRELTRIEGRE